MEYDWIYAFSKEKKIGKIERKIHGKKTKIEKKVRTMKKNYTKYAYAYTFSQIMKIFQAKIDKHVEHVSIDINVYQNQSMCDKLFAEFIFHT